MGTRYSLKRWVAAMVVSVSACTAPRMPGEAAPVPEVKHTIVNGARMAYVERGKGPTVVLVHGSMGDYRSWDRQAQVLSRHYRTVSYTQRYFGSEPWGSDWPRFGVGVHASDLAAFIRVLNAGPVHVVGWSYGASVALATAQQSPELVRSAFLYEPAHPTFVTDPADIKALTEDRAAFAPAVQAARVGDNVGSARLLQDIVDNRSGVVDAMPSPTRTIVLENSRIMPLLLTAQEPPPPIGCAQLGQVAVPIAVARGESTRVFYRVIGDAAARCLAKAQHIVVPKATHLWPGNDPAGFSKAVMAFLERH